MAKCTFKPDTPCSTFLSCCREFPELYDREVRKQDERLAIESITGGAPMPALPGTQDPPAPGDHELVGATRSACRCGWTAPLGKSILRAFDRHLLSVREEQDCGGCRYPKESCPKPGCLRG